MLANNLTDLPTSPIMVLGPCTCYLANSKSFKVGRRFLIIDAILLVFVIIICWGLYKIPIVNRLVKKIWRKYYEWIIAVLLSLFVSLWLLPKFFGN